MRRLAVMAVLMISVGLQTAAHAAPGDAVTVEISGIQRGSVVEGTVSMKAVASSAAGVRKLEFFVGGARVGTVEPDGVRQRVEIPHHWFTTHLEGTSQLAANGEYGLRARATAIGGADDVMEFNVLVDNPPSVPTGLTATSTDAGVALAWDANPEPDLLGYQVERGDGTNFEVIAETTETSYVDTAPEGSYVYRVVAIRNSVARSTGRPSLPSQPVEIEVVAAEVPSGSKSGGRSAVDGPKLSFGDGKDRVFEIDDRGFAPRGLPSGVRISAPVGLPGAPASAPELEWGTYEEELPYELPDGGVPISAATEGAPAFSWNVIPADGLRWVAAGALLLALSCLLRIVALKLDRLAGPPELKL